MDPDGVMKSVRLMAPHCLELQLQEEISQRRDRAREQKRLEEAATSSASSRLRDELPVQPGDTVAVFNWQAAVERFRTLEAGLASVDKDVLKRDLDHFARAMRHGPWRSITIRAGWRRQLDDLERDMPNFKPVIRFVAERIALSELGGAPLRPPPILLLGEPGLGKTHFTHRLAEALGTKVHRQAFDNVQSTMSLRGSERYWGNTTTGVLWDRIVLGTCANLMVLLDELDKSKGYRDANPADALLSLLEPVTAATIKDLSVDFEFDASHVWYVATANDEQAIRAPLRSRFTTFTIEAPDIDGRLAVANSIFAGTLAALVPPNAKRSFRPLSDLQVCRLAWLTPRQIRKVCERILGIAALAGRWHFKDEDFDEALSLPTSPAQRSRKARGNDNDDGDGSIVEGRQS
ncbi:AAA family ATPase [Variovorax sp. PAMC26660]|uniref:AAA family ATPase n=1 Tax=Variovorax sp. PAMC26660 TaxID=2762322 RepID=UPI00164E24BC|nr:AAA family ATPase [Variovorax sp. PAMC26660]QNK65818.1 AAA family ATPase [Variovorax sp. PAMC26660]